MITKSDLLQALKEVQESPYHTSAICINVCAKLRKLPQYQRNISQEREELVDMLACLFKKWSKYSGVPSYPVPSVTLGLTAYGQFSIVAIDRGSFWEGEYGELRKELLQFCIDTLTKELENEEPTS